ncbi:MAG: dethiobiotin synthase [Parvularculaceae bacterium]
MPARAWFVAATGTEIGKTHLCASLLAYWRAQGRSVAAFKPAMSGFADPLDTESDAARLLRACGRAVDMESIAGIAPFRYRAALAPDAAARTEGARLLMADIRPKLRAFLDGGAERKLIEGAGGVMSPIAEDGLNIDLIEEAAAPVLLAAGAYLGAISHTLTAVEALKARGAAIAAVVVNFHEAAGMAIDTTAEDIRRRLDPHIAVFALPARAAANDPAIADLAEALDKAP